MATVLRSELGDQIEVIRTGGGLTVLGRRQAALGFT